MLSRPILSCVFTAFVGAGFIGCAIGDGPGPLSELERPADGGRLSDAARQAVAKHAGQTEFAGRLWGLPTWFSGDWASVAPQGDKIQRSEFAVFNLGLFVFPLLPLWFSYDARLDQASGESGTSSTLWTPLYSRWSTSNWPGTEPAVRTEGLPLLYWWIEYGRLDERPLLEWNNTLWTLGPSWGRFDLDIDPEHADSEHAKGWFVVPVMLAGIGSWLWTSVELESTSADLTAHGPLNGLLGYKFEDDHDELERTRKVIGGILWYDVEEYGGDGSVFDARHGPLWGMFGWGMSDGEPGLRLFWFPIDV